eukprot:scaffold4501_cov395-Prasinococcus_capsulatus_cf.AAC.1
MLDRRRRGICSRRAGRARAVEYKSGCAPRRGAPERPPGVRGAEELRVRLPCLPEPRPGRSDPIDRLSGRLFGPGVETHACSGAAVEGDRLIRCV